MISYDWEYRYAYVGHRNLNKKGGRGSENQSVSGVTTIFLMQRNISPSHRVDQAVDGGLWNVVLLLFNGNEITYTNVWWKNRHLIFTSTIPTVQHHMV